MQQKNKFWIENTKVEDFGDKYIINTCNYKMVRILPYPGEH